MTNLKSLLDQGDQRAVDDADDGEQGEDISPGTEAEEVVAPGSEAEREEGHRDAEAAVGAELHDDSGEQHGGGGGRGDVAGGRPGVEGPQAGEDREADEDQREGQHLEVRREVAVRRGRGATWCGAGDDVGGDEADQHHGAADEGVERELHGAVLATRRAPDGDQEVLGDDDDLVEDEEQEEVEAEEDAVDRADEQQVEGEELFGAVLDVPGEEDAGDGDDPGEQDEGEADAVGGEVVLDAEGRDPGHAGDGEAVLRCGAARKAVEGDGEAGDGGERARGCARARCCLWAAGAATSARETRCRSSKRA